MYMLVITRKVRCSKRLLDGLKALPKSLLRIAQSPVYIIALPTEYSFGLPYTTHPSFYISSSLGLSESSGILTKRVLQLKVIYISHIMLQEIGGPVPPNTDHVCLNPALCLTQNLRQLGGVKLI